MSSLQDRIFEIAAKIVGRKERVAGNEAATKESLIKPFFDVLGWDTTDPDLWRPEYDADFNGRKKGEKVDYAILNDKTPIMLIEAKPYLSDEKALVSKDGQLARYFNATVSAKMSVITNGIVYRFFTDGQQANIQDNDPFIVVDLVNLTNETIMFLEMLTPQAFDGDCIQEWARKRMHDNKVREFIRSILTQPAECQEFTKLVLSNTREGAITKTIMEAFKQKLNTLMTQTINEIMTAKFRESISGSDNNKQALSEVRDNNSVETTLEELNLFHAIRGIIAGSGRDSAALIYKDYPRWFNISVKRPGNWFARFYSSDRSILLKIPLEELSSNMKLEEFSPISKGQNTLIKTDDKDVFELQEIILKTFDFVQAEPAITDEQENGEDSQTTLENKSA